MISRLYIGAAAAAVLSTSAFAADLPSKKMAPVPPPIPVFSWTGFYIGANAGYAFDDRFRFYTSNGYGSANGVPTVRPRNGLVNSAGFQGGGQIGYNYEFGDLFRFGVDGGGVVVGVEADAQYTDLSKSQDFIVGGRNNFVGDRLEYIGTARGRAGYAVDRVFLYGTGGFAYGEMKERGLYATGPVPAYVGSNSKTKTGYVYGAGIEYALPTASFLNFFNSSAVTVKGEFLHYELSRDTLLLPSTLTTAGPGSYTLNSRLGGNLVRAGLNFKFGVPVVPVVARY